MAEGGYWGDKTEPECVPNQSGLYGRHSQVQCQNASVEICVLLNFLGYGPCIRQARRDAYKEWGRLFTEYASGNATWITTGSKAEGLTRFMESDLDITFVLSRIMCIEDGEYSDILPRGTIVFRLSTIMCYPGHCRLLLELPAIINKAYIYKALCYDENGRPLLCSDLFVNLVLSGELMPFEVRHERAGPSMPCSLYDSIHIDLVYSLHCQCPRILQRWAERRRHWPSTDIVQKVVSLGAYVSPVGFKGSEYRRVEWRICFNTGENELVSNLNNIQVYMYVILKMVVKDVLKPVKKEISSYTVKNIVLWLAEKNSQTLFHEGSLLYWVHRGLGKLKTAILTERLSYYMIPKRNLMAACGLNGEQKRTWVATINDMMNEGSKLILRLPKIRRAILSHPEPLMWYSMKRVELELLDLKIMNREQVMHQNMVDNESDPMLLALNRRKDEILREVQERMGCEGCRANDLEAIYNMMLM